MTECKCTGMSSGTAPSCTDPQGNPVALKANTKTTVDGVEESLSIKRVGDNSKKSKACWVSALQEYADSQFLKDSGETQTSLYSKGGGSGEEVGEGEEEEDDGTEMVFRGGTVFAETPNVQILEGPLRRRKNN